MVNFLKLSYLLKKDNKLNTEVALFLFNHTNKTSINNAKNWLLKDHDIIIPKATFSKRRVLLQHFGDIWDNNSKKQSNSQVSTVATVLTHAFYLNTAFFLIQHLLKTPQPIWKDNNTEKGVKMPSIVLGQFVIKVKTKGVKVIGKCHILYKKTHQLRTFNFDFYQFFVS